MYRQPTILVLMHEPVLLEYRPGLFECHLLHAVQNVIRYLWTAVREALAMPVRRVLDDILRSKKTLLSACVWHSYREKHQTQNRARKPLKFSLHRCVSSSILVSLCWVQTLFGSNQVVPGICAFRATSSFISTPRPGFSVTVT